MTAQFVAFAAGLVAATALVCALALVWMRRRSASGNASVDVYKDQLRSLDKDLARGVVSAEDFDSLRAEIGRRALAAHKGERADPTQGHPWRVTLGVGALAVAGAIAVYPSLGAPGASDAPLAKRVAQSQDIRLNRISQAAAEAQITRPAAQADPQDVQLLDELRTALKTRPTSVRGFALLADTEARLGNPVAAHEAQARVLALRGANATAADHQRYAEFLIVAANGYVSPEAEAALRETLRRDPSAPLARFRLGTLYGQIGRSDLQFRTWDRLVREDDPALPFMEFVRQQLPALAERAGVQRYALPAGPGPSADDIAAAQDLSDADRQAMIEGMVGNLAQRLADSGGPPADWARLITSLGVLGRRDQAAAVWAEAQQTFADAPAALDLLAQAAQTAGLTP